MNKELQNSIIDKLMEMELCGDKSLPFAIDSEEHKELCNMRHLIDKYYKRFNLQKEVSNSNKIKEYEIIFDTIQDPNRDGNVMFGFMSDEAKENVLRELKEHNVEYIIHKAGAIDLIELRNDKFESQMFFNYLMTMENKKKLKTVDIMSVSIPQFMFNGFIK